MKITRTTLRLPCVTPYGYVEMDVEYDGDPVALGVFYRDTITGFKAGETNHPTTVKPRKIADASSTETAPDAVVVAGLKFKRKSKTDVLEEQFGSSASVLSHDALDPEGPGVTTLEEAEELIKSELGATDITDIIKEDTEEEPAPWEKPPAAPSDDDWDF